MNDVSSLEKVCLIAFCGPAAPRRPEELAAQFQARWKELTRGSPRILAMTQLASEADRLFARQALDLQVPLVVILPQPMEEWRKQLSPEECAEVEPLVAKAKSVDLAETRVPFSAARKLVDEADIVWVFERDDVSSDETSLVIERAQRNGREIHLLRETESALRLDPVAAGAVQLPGAAGVDVMVAGLGTPSTPAACPAELTRYYAACSAVADTVAPVYRKYFHHTVFANAIAAMAATVQLVFITGPVDNHPVPFPFGIPLSVPLAVLATTLTVIKFACLGLGMVIILTMKYRKSQQRWIDARLRTEMCRSAIITWQLPRLTQALEMDGQPAARDTVQFLRYLRAVSGPVDQLPLEKFKTNYGILRLKHQYNYYKGKADKADALSARLTPAYTICTFGAFAVSVIALAYPHFIDRHNHHPPVPGTWSYFLLDFIPIVAPACATLILGFEAIETLGRNRARYRELQELLSRALADLVAADSWPALEGVVERSEKILLSEVWEWYCFVKYSKAS